MSVTLLGSEANLFKSQENPESTKPPLPEQEGLAPYRKGKQTPAAQEQRRLQSAPCIA